MLSSLLLLSFPVLAAAADAPAAKPKADPNKVICREEEVTGSRLQTERKCMTSQQWAEYRRNQRESVEHTQTSPHP